MGFQYGGTVFIIVTRLEMPHRSTAQTNLSGVNVRPTKAA
jgi:hypothetical protein